jgi:hypothetical protein
MVKKILTLLAGLGLVPFCLGFGHELARTAAFLTFRPLMPYYFFLGGVLYGTVHVLFRKPIVTYVFGHELTHAFFALLFGGSVKSFHAGERGGRVTLTKSNVLITLAPYFFPIYTFVALLLFGAARLADLRGAEAWLVVLCGATYAFHVILTLSFLRIDQDDIREHGAFFSYPLILLFNILFAALVLDTLLARDMDFLRFIETGIIRSIRLILVLIGAVTGPLGLGQQTG